MLLLVDLGNLVQRGLRASNLFQTHAGALTPRLPQGLPAQLTVDIVLLGEQTPAPGAVRVAVRGATVGKTAALASAYDLVTAIRSTVSNCGVGKDVCTAYGVGVDTNPKIVKEVKQAITVILNRCASHPQEAASLGILPSDIAALQADLATITSVTSDQQQQRAVAPLTVQARDATAKRIRAAIKRIAAAGMLEFAKDPPVRAAFAALVRRPRAKKTA